MKKLLFLSLVFLSASVAAQAPVRLFNVRNGNGIIDGGVVQAQATYIVYKDAASKQAVIDAFCDLGSYNGVDKDGNPITKQQFFNRELTAMIKERVKQNRQRLAALQTPVVDESDLP